MRLLRIVLVGAGLVAGMVLLASRSAGTAAEAPHQLSARVQSGVVLHVRAGAVAAGADGSAQRPYPTITGALHAAPAHAQVLLAEGVYRERLALLRPVALVGAGALRTRIVSPGQTGTIAVVLSPGASVAGVSLEGGQVAFEVERGADLRLQDVGARDQSQAGLRLRGAALELRSGEIIDVGNPAGGYGIEAVDSTLELRDLLLRRAGRRGILLTRSRARLVEVDIESSGLTALQVTDACDVEVAGGRFAGQGGAGIFAAASRLRIQGARIERNELGVMGARGSTLEIDSSQIIDQRVTGVAFTNSSGAVRRSLLVRGGTDSAISVSESENIVIEDNQIVDPGPVGIHLRISSVTLRGNEVRGARLDGQRDFGDGIFALQAELVLRGNLLHDNAGHGAAVSLSTVELSKNDLVDNGRDGVLLFHQSKATLTDNLFSGNAGPALEVVERSYATLRRNRFGGSAGVAIEGSCQEAGRGGNADLVAGNTFAPGVTAPGPCP